MSILVINAGSSSLKFGLFDVDARETLATGLIDWTADPQHATLIVQSTGKDDVRSHVDVADHRSALAHAVRLLVGTEPDASDGLPAIRAIGHRVVHGGTLFLESTLIDSSVKAAIARLAELAPLHNPPALEGIAAAEATFPGMPQVAVFDTAFHAHLPLEAHVYPLPYEWYSHWGIRRFGFHGISHAYCASRAAEMLSRNLCDLRLVSCHLGNGCSAAAIRGGVSAATTMGFTPLEGLMMGSRPGSVDPGILVYVQQRHGLTSGQLEDLLNHRSGLLGISGVSSDFRQVEVAAREGNDRARLALDIYAARVRAAVGALAVTMGGIDALVFTAGVGEHSATLRAAACDGLACLELRLDRQYNAASQPDADIATADSPGRILIIHTREELMIARETCRVALHNSKPR